MNKKGFIKTFSIPELKSIFGKGGTKIFILIIILLTSLTLIGVANGSKEYLNKKMESPWIKFIDIETRYNNWQEGDKGVSANKLKQVQEKFQFKDPQELKKVYLNFLTKKGTNKNDKQMISIIMDSENPFYEELVKEENNRVISNRCNLRAEELECIITLKGLEILGYETDQTHLKWYVDSNLINIPISGIVEDLKDGVEFLITQRVYDVRQNISEFGLNDTTSVHFDYLRYFIQGNPDWNEDDIFKILKDKKFELEEYSTHTHLDGIIIEGPFSLSNLNLIKSHFEENNIKYTRIYDLKKDEPKINVGRVNNDIITVFFEDFDKIPAFAEYLEREYNIIINKTDIENKKNITFFNKLINLLAYSLIIFSILSIVFFITNLILSHLKNNKKNMGTLKAFGLNNNSIIITYSFITFVLIIICFSISYVFSELVGSHFLETLVAITKSENGYLSEVTYNNLSFGELFIMMGIIPCLFILFNVLKYLHGVTPGDLIYERK